MDVNRYVEMVRVSEDTLVMLGDGKCLVKSDDICKDGFGHSVVVGAGRLSWAPFYSFCSRLAWYQLAQHVMGHV